MTSKLLKIDWMLLVSIFLLLGIGLLALYSISVGAQEGGLNIFSKQIIYVFVGILGMIFFIFFDHQYLKNYGVLIYFGTLFVLLMVLIFGVSIRGTTGWIVAGPFHLQPVEISKLALVIALASFLSKKKLELSEMSRIIASFVIVVLMIFLVIRQPDFGSSMVLFGIWLGMVIFSGIEKKYFFGLAAVGVIAAFLIWSLLAGYQKNRISNLFQPEIDPQGSGYNVIQSMVAVGSGGLVGRGIGHGSQSQLNFLPEKHTDFIFAVIAEESGLLGAIITLSLFAVAFYRMKKIAQSARDNFGYLIVVGVMITFFIQILVNVGMNIGLMPVTGIPLPFLSYGGSSLVSMFISLGIVFNIYLSRKRNKDFQVMQSQG